MKFLLITILSLFLPVSLNPAIVEEEYKPVEISRPVNSENLLVLAAREQIGRVTKYESLSENLLVLAAREQIGRVTKYDTGYYQGGYPPSGSGACTDVIDQALSKNGYNIKQKIDDHMNAHPELYTHTSDPNINFRRVVNVKIFLDHQAEKLTTKTDAENIDQWLPGDIVTYDQIPGSLWHIAIVSDQKNSEGIPLLIHNYGRGIVEDDKLLSWPAPITGHYRLASQ